MFGGRRESQLYNLEFIVLSKASAHALAKSVYNPPCPARYNQNQNENQNKIKKRIRVKDSVVEHL